MAIFLSNYVFPTRYSLGTTQIQGAQTPFHIKKQNGCWHKNVNTSITIKHQIFCIFLYGEWKNYNVID